MPWNLVDALSAPNQPRPFHLPLASIPPGSTSVRKVTDDQFEPQDEKIIVSGEVKDLVFRIRIKPPSGGSFSDEGAMLPDPALRLHAMAPGTLVFKPADKDMGNRLILEMPRFMSLPEDRVRWWERWTEARCIPRQIIYENVDKTELENRLKAIDVGKTLHGLGFPMEVTNDQEKKEFITSFMSNADQGFSFLMAEAGAVIGTAAVDPNDANFRLLKLRGRYRTFTTNLDEAIMNPREFFHLLFGDDSNEAGNHPLLLKIDKVGKTHTGHETESMRLRPPLRTHARVMWEAAIEQSSHAADWALPGDCHARVFNRHSREGYVFSPASTYQTYPKCNVFISDMAVRSGFRAIILPASNKIWHYHDVNGYVHQVDAAPNINDRQPLRGTIDKIPFIWGWKIERWLRSLPDTERMPKLNEAIQEEGRCFILAGSRAAGHSGHIVIVESFDRPPILVDAKHAGDGMQTITITTREARTAQGAASRPMQRFLVGGSGGGPDTAHGFVHLHVFELHPGQDPDTPYGLRDCNVRV